MSDDLKDRKDVPEKYRWNLERIYDTDDRWEDDFGRLKAMLSGIEKYRGRLGESAAMLLGCLELKDDISRLCEKLYVYAHMRRDEDNTNSKYQGLASRSEGVSTDIDREFSFMIPEVLQIPQSRLASFLRQQEGLRVYRHYIDEIIRMKEHVLSPDQERIVSMAGDIALVPENAYRMLSSADIEFPTTAGEDGSEVKLSEGRYYQLIRSRSREVRRDAFDRFYSTYKKYGNTMSAILSGAVKKDIFYARVRGYKNSLESALFGDNVPVSVYDNIIDTVNSNLKPLHRYMKIRKRMLKLDRVHMYDLYAPLVGDADINIPYEDGLNMVAEALKPLGDDYVSILKSGFGSRWIDVYENKGKTNGAYSWGSYDTSPYVLMNYNNSLSDVSTIAHEMGHSVHSYLSRKEQPYIYSEYTLFCAEVASTTNEALFMEYLLKTTADRTMRMYIINQYLEEIRTTVYRQTMFAEFERDIHQRSESGEALTSETLSSMWHDLNVKYYGPDVVVDDGIDIEWARISHFYWDFYVYKYVTGYAAAMSLSAGILEQGRAAVERYIDFLKSGDSDYSIDLLKRAGVDMTTPKPLLNTVSVFERLLDELGGDMEQSIISE